MAPNVPTLVLAWVSTPPTVKPRPEGEAMSSTVQCGGTMSPESEMGLDALIAPNGYFQSTALTAHR